MKKQIILIAAVFLLAVAVGVAAIVVGSKGSSDIVSQDDGSYKLNESLSSLLSDTGITGSITLSGYDKGDADMARLAEVINAVAAASEGRIVSGTVASGEKQLEISVCGKSAKVDYADVYARLSDGTAYAFFGEKLIAENICSLAGKDKIELEGTALDGYDLDGDTTLKNGRPFMYPSITRNDVASIKVTNPYGTYKVYKDTTTKSFFFEGAEYVDYDSEKFSMLVVNATYVLASGKVNDPLSFEEYGLTEDKATCTLLVVTVDGASHKILIGNKTASGGEYYARYVGKDFVYRLPASDIDQSLMLPISDFLTALLVYPMTENSDIYKLNNVNISFKKDGTEFKASQFELASLSPNAKSFGEIATTELLVDGNYATAKYNGWTSGDLYGAFSSTDGEECYVQLTLVNYAVTGEYEVKFGLLREESTNAYLPSAVNIEYSTDWGKTFTRLEKGIKPEQNNQECKRYSASFHSDEPVQYIRLCFTTRNGKYVVMDEVRAYADGEDCQPADALVGNWKVTEPKEYIPVGKNFIYPDSSNFTSTFLSSVGTLVGEKVVESGICSNVYDASTIDQTALAKYGLDKPDLVVAYDLKGWTSTVYIKQSIEDSKLFYAYSTETYVDEKGEINMCTGIIATLSLENVAWLGWDIVDYMDHNLLSMYIDDIISMTLTFEGKEYLFRLSDTDGDGKLNTVTCNGQTVDTSNFRHLYISLISISLKGEYSASDDNPQEIMRVTIDGKNKDPEIVFYRVSASKAYYTVNGQGRYYVLVDKVNTLKKNVALLLAGEYVPR